MSLYRDVKKYLTEMSRDKQTLKNKLDNQVNPIYQHLIKLYLYGDKTQDFSHWIDEIADKIPYLDTLKPNNKFPKASLVYDILVDDDSANLSRKLNVLTKNLFFRYPKVTYDISEITYFVDAYMRWLTNELNTKHEVHAEDVNKQINRLLNKCKHNNKVK